MAAPLYRPQTIQMPDAAWGQRRDLTRSGFSRPLSKDDLALDPQRVLMTGSIYDGLAAAMVDAEEDADFRTMSERQDPRSLAVGRERRAFWDVGASYVHPPMDRDVSTGPGAFSWPDPDIVPRQASEDLVRRDASAPLREVGHPIRMQRGQAQRGQAQAQWSQGQARTQGCPGCGSALRCACSSSDRAHLTKPSDDEATEFMVGFYAPGHVATTAGAARATNAGARRGGQASAGGFGRVAARAMRTGTPVGTEAAVYGSGPAYSSGPAYGSPHDPAIYGRSVPSAVPAYDTPYTSPAVLGVPNRYGLHKMPGTIDTTALLLQRDAAVQGIANPFAPLGGGDRAPRTDALGFRFADRAQFGYNVPKFFPARDPLDKLLYETAAGVAPDMAADVADMAALRGMDNMIEPLSARYEMMREVAKDMVYSKDPYMIPRTGPSVLHPGRMAQPPDWYVRPGSGKRSW